MVCGTVNYLFSLFIIILSVGMIMPLVAMIMSIFTNSVMIIVCCVELLTICFLFCRPVPSVGVVTALVSTVTATVTYSVMTEAWCVEGMLVDRSPTLYSTQEVRMDYRFLTTLVYVSPIRPTLHVLLVDHNIYNKL